MYVPEQTKCHISTFPVGRVESSASITVYSLICEDITVYHYMHDHHSMLIYAKRIKSKF